jgi:hypothetical protein
MLSGYQPTNGLTGLGCGLDTQCGCKGMGDLLDPTTWGPADWLVAAGAVFVGYKLFAGEKQRRYTRLVRRRLGAEA